MLRLEPLSVSCELTNPQSRGEGGLERRSRAVELRFLRNAPERRSNFAVWLDSLETQLQFRQSTQPGNPG